MGIIWAIRKHNKSTEIENWLQYVYGKAHNCRKHHLVMPILTLPTAGHNIIIISYVIVNAPLLD